jgi:hypothetical protein
MSEEDLKRRLYDNTRISSYKSCPRAFYYAHERDWRKEGTATALIFGGAWHNAMDVLWEQMGNGTLLSDSNVVDLAYEAFVAKWLKEGLPAPDQMGPDEIAYYSPRTPMVAKEMLYGYLEARREFFADPTFKLISIEQPFAVPLDPEDTTLWYVGRLDKVFELKGNIHVGEHKTSTAYRVNGPFRNDFLDSWSPNSQVDGYLYALRSLYGKKAKSVWIDAALVHKKVHNGFRFIPVDRQYAQLDAWLWSAHCWIDQIEGNKEVLRLNRDREPNRYLDAFPQNTGACGNYGGCSYRDLCKTLPNPEKEKVPPLGYKEEHWSPFDEIKLEQIGMDRESTGETENAGETA